MLAGMLIAALGVSVDVDAPAPTCDWATTVPAALARLPSLTVTASAALTVRLTEGDGEVRVVLSEDGRPQADRSLPATPPCEVRADAIALVVEQQLTRLGYVSPPEPVPAMTATSTPADDPPRAASPAPRAIPPPPRASSGPGVRLQFGLEGLLDLSARLDDGVAVEVGVRFEDRFAALLRLSSILPESTPVTRDGAEIGDLTVWSGIAMSGGEACWAAGPGQACGIALAGLEWSRGWASGETVFRSGTENALRFVAGAGARFRLPIGNDIGLRAGAKALWRPNGPTFVVEDGAEATTPVLTLRLSMGVDYSL